MAQANVISYFRKKDINGNYTSPSYFGTEQRFVNALRGSNNNNLEEQFLLGVDCVTTTWTDNNNVIRISKEFYDTTSGINAGYYILQTYIYSDGDRVEDYFIQDNALQVGGGLAQFEVINDLVTFVGSSEVYNFKGDMLEIDMAKVIDAGGDVFPDPAFITIRKDVLQYKQLDGNIINVSQKMIGKKTTSDGKEIINEIIVNFL